MFIDLHSTDFVFKQHSIRETFHAHVMCCRGNHISVKMTSNIVTMTTRSLLPWGPDNPTDVAGMWPVGGGLWRFMVWGCVLAAIPR